MRAYLRVKIKSLAAEAAIIRLEERRAAQQPELRASLRSHRVVDVRREARAAQLAYAYIRGRSVDATEPPPRDGRNTTTIPATLVSRVEHLVRKYGAPDGSAAGRVREWLHVG